MVAMICYDFFNRLRLLFLLLHTDSHHFRVFLFVPTTTQTNNNKLVAYCGNGKEKMHNYYSKICSNFRLPNNI